MSKNNNVLKGVAILLMFIIVGGGAYFLLSGNDDEETKKTNESTRSASVGNLLDGSYSAKGDYVSPAGDEAIQVDITLKDQTITNLEITSLHISGKSEKYNNDFADEVQGTVVGKKLEDAYVGVVSGASLTSDAFNKALDQIAADAQR